MRLAAVALAVLATAGSARAQGVPAPSAQVEAEHRRGMALFRQHRDAEAREVFRALVARTQEPRARARLAATEAALGEWVAAEEHLRDALAATRDPWVQANRSGADGGLEGDLRRYASHVGRVEVRCETPGAEVWIGGARAATLPMDEPLRVAAGEVTLEVRAEGHLPELRREVVPGGPDALVRVRVTLTPAPQGPPPSREAGAAPTTSAPVTAATRAVAPTGRPWFVLGLAATGLGAAGLAAGVTGLVLRNAHATAFNDNPRCGVTNDVVTGGDACQAEYDARTPLETLSLVGFVAGGALVVAGVVTLVVGATTSGPARPTLSVTSGPGDVGIGLRGTLW